MLKPFILFTLLTALPCFAQYHDLDPALAKAAREYDRAQIESDRAALEQLVADDYLIMRGNGTLGDKKLLIEVVAGEGLKNNPYTIEKPFQRIYGNTVILGGWVHLTGTDHGKPWVQNARFADTWSRRNGKWQVVFTSVVLTNKP
jgi:hypothetical protein